MISPPFHPGAPSHAPIRTQPFGWLTEPLAAVFALHPERLHAWLAAPRAEWHFAGIVFALNAEPLRFEELEAMMFVRKKADILTAAAPDAPQALLKMPRKLRGDLWRPASYRRLAALLDEAAARRLLVRAKSVDRRKLLALSKVPSSWRSPEVFRRLNKPGDAEKVVFAVRLVERIRPDLTRAAILRSLSQTPAKQSLEAWTRRHFRAASFPAPPWAGTEKLKPLSSWDMIQSTALSFRNCIKNYVREILEGGVYLYLYTEGGVDQAVVEFLRVADDVWAIGEINGPDNKPLTASQEAAVVSEAAGTALKLPAQSSIWSWADPSY